jgi:hypothetical protein
LHFGEERFLLRKEVNGKSGVILAMILAKKKSLEKPENRWQGFWQECFQNKYLEYFGIICSKPWIAVDSERLVPAEEHSKKLFECKEQGMKNCGCIKDLTHDFWATLTAKPPTH